MPRSSTSSRWHRLRTLSAVLVVGALLASSGPSAAAASEHAGEFAAGYRTGVDNGTKVVATLQVPRVACRSGDVVAVTIHAMVMVRTRPTGAEFTGSCESGSAHYTGTYLFDRESRPIPYEVRGGDLITVMIEDGPVYTLVQVYSLTRGWGEGNGFESVDFTDAVYTVSATGQVDVNADTDALDALDQVGAQRFRFVRVDGHRFGKVEPEPFDDACTDVTPLRRGLSFDTTFVC